MHPWLRRAALAGALLFAACAACAKSAGEVYREAAPSVVVVENLGAGGKIQAVGSGVVFAAGSVATNCHVVADAAQIVVRSEAAEYPAALRNSNRDRDVCSLAVAGLAAPVAAAGDSRALEVGATVYAIGAPKGLELKLSAGTVSHLHDVDGEHYIQSTAAISPGSSGGGLFDDQGALVGLTTFYVSAGQDRNFALPVEWVRDLAQRGTQAPAHEASAARRLNRAIELGSRKDWPALAVHCRGWTMAEPDSELAWMILGIAYEKSGHLDPAIEAYRRLLRLEPADAASWLLLGNAETGAGRPDQAIAAYRRALRLEPRNADVWNLVGTVYAGTAQPARAIEAYRHALAVDPAHADTWYNLGILHAKAGRFSDAIQALQQALRIDPHDAEAWFDLGVVYAASGGQGQAAEILERLKELDPALAQRFADLLSGQ